MGSVTSPIARRHGNDGNAVAPRPTTSCARGKRPSSAGRDGGGRRHASRQGPALRLQQRRGGQHAGGRAGARHVVDGRPLRHSVQVRPGGTDDGSRARREGLRLGAGLRRRGWLAGTDVFGAHHRPRASAVLGRRGRGRHRRNQGVLGRRQHASARSGRQRGPHHLERRSVSPPGGGTVLAGV